MTMTVMIHGLGGCSEITEFEDQWSMDPHSSPCLTPSLFLCDVTSAGRAEHRQQESGGRLGLGIMMHITTASICSCNGRRSSGALSVVPMAA